MSQLVVRQTWNKQAGNQQIMSQNHLNRRPHPIFDTDMSSLYKKYIPVSHQTKTHADNG